MIYIMADDLTGANDSGVQLSKQGLKTVVYIGSFETNSKSSKIDKDTDVLVIDTETRDLKEDQIEDIIKKNIEELNLHNKNDIMFYKKIDSTLRGNFGKEIELLMKFLNKDLCILSPGFPDNGRITVGGYLIVNNEPLGSSQYFNNQFEPWEGTYIPHFIQQKTELPVGLIELKDVMKGEQEILKRIEQMHNNGKRIIVIDAVIEEHLKQIMNSSKNFQGSILYCGSAGLANYLETNIKEKVNSLTIDKYSGKPVLIVIGTRNKIMEEQIQYLEKNEEINYLKIDLEKMLDNPDQVLEKYIEKGRNALNNNKDLILQPDPVYNNNKHIKKYIGGKVKTFRDLEMYIRDFMALLTVKIIKQAGLSELVITGGDTAIGVCKAIGVDSLNIIEEISPGIPLTVISNKELGNIKFITKAGGFGNRKTLCQILSKVKNI